MQKVFDRTAKFHKRVILMYVQFIAFSSKLLQTITYIRGKYCKNNYYSAIACQVVLVPCLESFNAGSSFRDSADEFIINMNHFGESAAKICKLVSCWELFSLDKDRRLDVGLTRCRLVHDRGDLRTWCEAELAECIGNPAHAVLNLRFRACTKSPVVNKEKVSQHVLLDFGDSLQSA